MTERHSRNLIVACFLLAWSAGLGAAASTLQFDGVAIECEELALAILAPQDRTHVILIDKRYAYSVALPYNKSWKFSRASDSIIKGENARYRVTVKRIPKRHATPLARLESVLAAVEKSGMVKLKKPTFVDGNDLPVLKYRAKLSNPPRDLIRNPKWIWEFWTAVPHGHEWVSVHVTVGLPGEGLSKKKQTDLAAVLGQLVGGNE